MASVALRAPGTSPARRPRATCGEMLLMKRRSDLVQHCPGSPQVGVRQSWGPKPARARRADLPRSLRAESEGRAAAGPLGLLFMMLGQVSGA